MTSAELESQKNTFVEEVDGLISEYQNTLESVSSINLSFENSNDTILKTIASNNNSKISTIINDFISKAGSIKSSIVSKTDSVIEELKRQEEEARKKAEESKEENTTVDKPGKTPKTTDTSKSANYVREV